MNFIHGSFYYRADVDSVARQALAVIGHDGSVSWFPHTIFRSSCSLDVTNFPFDNQSCHMWFGSWTHPSDQINLTMLTESGIDLSTFQSDFKDGSGWDIYKVHAERKVKGEGEKVPKFTIVTFELYMRRKMVFSSYILTLPCVFLACLTLVVFWLPPDRPDRTSLGKFIQKKEANTLITIPDNYFHKFFNLSNEHFWKFYGTFTYFGGSCPSNSRIYTEFR